MKPLFDFGFLKQDMLARHGVVFLQFKLFRGRTGILLRYVIETRISTADEFDKDCARFGHGFLGSRE